MYNVRNKRINGFDRAVFDVFHESRFVATVEVNSAAGNGLKVLQGALQPAGKELVWTAIRAYEMPHPA